MKKLTLKQAAEDCHGTLAPEQAEAVVTGVQIDSRRVKPGDLFIAIKGEKVDGHGGRTWCERCARRKAGQGLYSDHSCA